MNTLLAIAMLICVVIWLFSDSSRPLGIAGIIFLVMLAVSCAESQG